METHTQHPVQSYTRLLAHYLRPQRAQVLLLTVLLFTAIGLQLAIPQLVRDFIETAQAGGALDSLVRAALVFIGIALVQQVTSVAATYVGEDVGWTATNALRDDLAAHCLQLDMTFHTVHTPGEMIERVDGDVTTLATFFSQFVVQVLGNGLLLLGILVLLFREDWRIGLALTGFSLLALFVLARLRDVAVPHWTAEREASADLFGFLEERLAGTEDIRSSGGEAYTLRHFYRLMRAQMRSSRKAALMINILLNAMFVLTALGMATAFGVSTALFRAGTLSLGTAYLIFHYTTMLERPIQHITRQMQEFQKAAAGIVRIRELFQTRSRIQSPAVPQILPAGPLAVAFEDVTFIYHDRPAGSTAKTQEESAPAVEEVVLHDVSFRLHSGTVLGLLGRTGSGKTTLTRLLFRLYDPDRGSVRLGDGEEWVDVRHVPLPHLRRRVGMVTQNVQLFHASVRDNLTFFDRSIPDARVLQAIEDLGLGEWLHSLPEGLDTVLASGGGGLSAGEAQLLAFTRIFLQDPGLVILDEASSRLDPATEQLIERAVERLARDRTMILIAHRLGTVERAGEIMILERGRILEHGERAALASDPGSRFHRLLQTGLEEVLA
jgi:ATP-binding cassette subfamily B protein